MSRDKLIPRGNKMKLNLPERFEALRILPEQGNFATLKIISNLRKDLAPSEDEHKKFCIQQQGDQIIWDSAKGAEEVEIPIGEKATDIIVDALKKLDESGTMTARQMSLYEKFVE